jgi:hypothetical protein
MLVMPLHRIQLRYIERMPLSLRYIPCSPYHVVSKDTLILMATLGSGH